MKNENKSLEVHFSLIQEENECWLFLSPKRVVVRSAAKQTRAALQAARNLHSFGASNAEQDELQNLDWLVVLSKFWLAQFLSEHRLDSHLKASCKYLSVNSENKRGGTRAIEIHVWAARL